MPVMEQESAPEPQSPKKSRFSLGVALWPLLGVPVWWAVVGISHWTGNDGEMGIGGMIQGLMVVAAAGCLGGVGYAVYAMRKWKMPIVETAIGMFFAFPLLALAYTCGGCGVVGGIGWIFG